jgi:hypothetical protein
VEQKRGKKKTKGRNKSKSGGTEVEDNPTSGVDDGADATAPGKSVPRPPRKKQHRGRQNDKPDPADPEESSKPLFREIVVHSYKKPKGQSAEARRIRGETRDQEKADANVRAALALSKLDVVDGQPTECNIFEVESPLHFGCCYCGKVYCLHAALMFTG